MTELQMALAAMCLMGIAFAWCIKLLFDAFIAHLKVQSDLTTSAVDHASNAIALNGRVLQALTDAVSATPQDTTHD